MHFSLENLRAISYLDLDRLAETDRIVNLMPLWEGGKWHQWVPNIEGKLVEAAVIDTVEGDYLAVEPARDSDLFVPFFDFLWQRASWPEVCPFISAISDDFHNMGTSVAKLKHLFDCRRSLPDGAGGRFAKTELEYIVILSRSVFDLLQEMISTIWTKRVQLLDLAADKRRRAAKLPETFSKVVLCKKKNLRPPEEIEREFAIPANVAAAYAAAAPFFLWVREHRNDVLHGLATRGTIFVTEKGYCVDPKVQPFSSFDGWQPQHYYNTNIVSLLPWLAEVVHGTIRACTGLVEAIASVIKFPPKLAPSYRVFVRGPYASSLASVLQVRCGATPWWG